MSTTNEIKVRLRTKTDTDANWTSVNPILLKGEIGIVSDKNNIFKVGDGKTAWKDLTYATSYKAITASTSDYATMALTDNKGQQIDTTYYSDISINGKAITLKKGDGTSRTIYTQDTNTEYSKFGAATQEKAGTQGLVPAPGAGDQAKFLKADGTWGLPSVSVPIFKGASASSDGTTGTVPTPGAGNQAKYLRGDGTWAVPTNNTYNVFKGSSSSTAGGSGLVPAPPATVTKKFLASTGSFEDIPVSVMTGASSAANGAAGAVPAPSMGQQAMYLRGDGTWATPPNTTYPVASDKATGTVKLYTALGDNTDGSITQSALKSLINGKAASSHNHAAGNITSGTLDAARLPASGITAGTYRSVTIDTYGRATAGSNPTTLAGYGITDAAAKTHTHTIANVTNLQSTLDGKAAKSHTHASGDITSLDASKLTGTISIDRLPAGALERCVIVEDDTARFKLTATEVQNGDTVKVTATSKMYFVKDQTNLTTEDGYEVYTAGTATAVPWSGVTGKPSTFTPSGHTHTIANITNLQSTLDGKAASSHNHSAANITSGTLNKSRLPASGVTAGTYRSVTVDAYGRVTAGSNPTTLSGYGITDAAAKSHTHAISDITNLQSTLNGKAASSHNHSAANITSGTLDAARLPASGVKAGTYRSVTVDAYGRVTAGTAPTTLSGYGITDAAAKSHTHAISDITNLQSTLNGKAASSHTHSYLPLSGGTLTGSVIIKKDTEASNAYGSTNPSITFQNSNATQNMSIIYSDYDNVQTPASITFIGNQGGEYVIAPNFKATVAIYEGGSKLSDKYQAKGNYAGSSSAGGAANSAVKWSSARVIEGLSVQGNANRVAYGSCSTAAATAAKVVSCAGFSLVTGSQITVKFTVTNTAANPTLNVNGTGAKAIYYRGAAIAAGYLAANRTYSFRYNGTQYELVGDINTDTNTNNACTQTITDSGNADYRVLFSVTADSTTRTEGARKSGNLLYNPTNKTLYCTNFAGAIDFGDEG